MLHDCQARCVLCTGQHGSCTAVPPSGIQHRMLHAADTILHMNHPTGELRLQYLDLKLDVS